MSCSIYWQLMKDRRDYLESAIYNQKHGHRADAQIDFYVVHYIEKLIKKLRKGEIEWY